MHQHRVYTKIKRPPAELIARFAPMRLEWLVQASASPRLMHHDIKPMDRAAREVTICGPAVTVLPVDADMNACIAAMGVVQPGDVVVVAAGGISAHASWGGGLTLSSQAKGVNGVVVDGLAMDSTQILTRTVPVYCRGTTLRHRIASLAGSVNVPVGVGGVQVNPGDLIIGDRDGVMVVPRDEMEELLGKVEAKMKMFDELIERCARTGETIYELRGCRESSEKVGVQWVEDYCPGT